MKIICVCCGKQAIKDAADEETYITTLKGARAAFHPHEIYCGNCAEDMDENGLFPEEMALIN
jgi:hypothetical protein